MLNIHEARRPTRLDQKVGRRLRQARHEAKMSTGIAAGTAGFSPRQMLKVERGEQRLTAARLYILAGLYGKPMTWFFQREEQDKK